MSRPAGGGFLAGNARPAHQLARPAAGVLVRGWGDPDEGQKSTGLSWRTAPGAQVLAPCGGTAVYAAPFRGFGLLAIVDCGGGYHAVLGGLERIAAAAGKTVQAGDVLGSMLQDPAARPPLLYLEFRKNGRPVDPAPWLAPGGP